jgi:hypothetical protein
LGPLIFVGAVGFVAHDVEALIEPDVDLAHVVERDLDLVVVAGRTTMSCL